MSHFYCCRSAQGTGTTGFIHLATASITLSFAIHQYNPPARVRFHQSLTRQPLKLRKPGRGSKETYMTGPNFRFTHYDLKSQRAGTAIEVTLSAVNNIRLMNAANYQRFTERLDFKYAGGVARKSPVRLVIPENGHWHLIVDTEGHHGLAESSVKLIPAPAMQSPQ